MASQRIRWIAGGLLAGGVIGLVLFLRRRRANVADSYQETDWQCANVKGDPVQTRLTDRDARGDPKVHRVVHMCAPGVCAESQELLIHPATIGRYLTVVMTTSPVISNPSTNLIEASMRIWRPNPIETVSSWYRVGYARKWCHRSNSLII